MTTIAAHTTWMTGRQLRAITRQPAYIVIMLIQPVIWLFLFGSLFRKVVELPGFGAPSYLDYLVPGVVIMSALSSSMWSGMTVLEEIDRGIMDRFLVLPLHRSAIINASAVLQALTVMESRDKPVETLADAEEEQIRRVLSATGGNKSKAAQILGIERKTLYRKLDRMKL